MREVKGRYIIHAVWIEGESNSYRTYDTQYDYWEEWGDDGDPLYTDAYQLVIYHNFKNKKNFEKKRKHIEMLQRLQRAV